MKSAKIKILKLSNIIISSLLGLLGFASCEGLNEPKCEYGTPHAKFIINGKIEAEDTNNPIQKISVVMKGEQGYKIAESESCSKGVFQIVDGQGFPGNQKYNLIFEDVDGPENGEYQKLDTIIEFKDPEFKGGKSWYKGETSKEINIKLKPKK